MKAGSAFPTATEWVFSLKTFFASMAALYIGLAAGLPRPYWAMATVYIVANPLTGLTRSKASFRTVGTLAGASMAIFLTPPLANWPILFTLVVSLWTGLLTFLALFDRTPRSYAFMLSGYTVPLIAFPSIYAPGTVFDTGVARAEEIILGIVCASVVNSVVFPASLTGTVRSTAGNLLKDIGRWVGSVVENGRDADALKESERLALDVTILDNLIVHLRYDVAAANMTRHLKAFKERVAPMPIVLHGLGDRLATLRDRNAVDDDLDDLLTDLRLWIGAEAEDEMQKNAGAARLREKHARLARAISTRHDWDGLLIKSTLADILHLIDMWQDCQALLGEISAGTMARRRVDLQSTRAVEGQWHHDIGVFAITGASVALAGFIASLMWLYSGWQAGVGFAMMALIAGPFFGAMDNPLPALKAMAVFMGISNLLAGIFLFGVLPGVSSFGGLVVIFAVPFILFGTIMSRPQFALPGMLMTVGTASTVALSSTYSADFVSFMDGAIASVLGVLFAVVWSGLTHSLGASRKAQRIARMGWRDLAAISNGRMEVSVYRYAARGIDRLAQFVPRRAALSGTALEKLDMITELRVGTSLAILREQSHLMATPQARGLDSVFNGLAGWFNMKAGLKAGDVPSPAILSSIDDALCKFDDERVLAALTNLRRSLYPQAAAPIIEQKPARSLSGSSPVAAE